MMPSGPSVQIIGQYAQSIRDTSTGKNKNDSRRVDPANPNYHKTGGDSNLAREFVRHGPDALYAHIMRAAFDPVYGREMSIAQQEFEKPQTRFPLIEATREHERSENNNSPQKVYNISFSQILNGTENKDGKDKKSKDKDYEPYSQNYKYKSDNNVVVYGHVKPKDKEKNRYKIEAISESLKEKILDYFKKDYKVEFPDGNKDSLYMKSLRILSEIYNNSRKNKYANANGYNPAAEAAGNYSESDDAYPILLGAVYGATIQYNSPPKKPANENYILEQRLGIGDVSAQGGLEGKIAA